MLREAALSCLVLTDTCAIHHSHSIQSTLWLWFVGNDHGVGRQERGVRQTFLDLTEKVRANEPGNVFYALHKSGGDPQVYKVMEQYDSPEALDAHGKTDYFREANKQLAGFVAGAPEIEILEAVTR